MPSSTVCWGIEVGSAAIKALKLEAVGDNQVRVVDYAVINHPKVLSTPGVDRNEVLRVSLGAFASQFDLKGASVAVSVPGHSAFARFAKLPPVEPKKVPDIVKFEAMQQIPFPLEQVEWDYQTFVSQDSPDVEVGIFAITKERVNEQLQLLGDYGIVPSHVVLSPIAVYNALSYDLEFGATTPGTIIVDVGTTSTDLVIATPGRMWVRTFPIGGHQFTEALVSAFQASYPKAEKLKREAEDSPYARQIFQAMRPVFTDLAQDIQRSIGYFQSIHKDAQLTRLIGVGSTFHLPGLRKYLKQQLSMDVYRIEEFKKLKAGGEKARQFDDASLNLCTAYGLGLQGLGMNAVSGNLMPVSIIKETMWKSKVPWFGLAAGLAIAASGAMFIRPFMDYLAVENSGLSAQAKQTIARASELKKAAEAAGVTSAGEPNYDAANMVALLEGKGVYPRLAADVGEIFASAQKRAEGWAKSVGAEELPADTPALSMASVSTTYEPAKAAEAVDPYSAPSGGRGPSRAGYDGGGADQSLAEKLGITAYPRIKVEIVANSPQPELRRFIIDSVNRWLQENSKREGVPYQLKFDDPPFSVVDAGATGPGAAPTRGAYEGYSQAQQDEIARQSARNAGRGGRVVGGPVSNPADDSARVATAVAQGAIDRLAPLGNTAEESEGKGKVTITFYAAFIPPQPAGEAGGAK